MTSYTEIDDLPPMRYDVIAADPPWLFQNYSQKGERKNALKHYSCLGFREIAKLNVGQCAAADCVVAMWVTNPMIAIGAHVLVLQGWGFTPSTAGHWIKRTKTGKIAFGTGYVLRSAGEPYIIATSGSPKFARNVRSVIEGEVREHSRKPDAFYDMLEKLVPDATARLDLFSRETRPGWDSCGWETTRFDD